MSGHIQQAQAAQGHQTRETGVLQRHAFIRAGDDIGRVDDAAVHADFEVDVRICSAGVSGAADGADNISAVYRGAFLYADAGQVSVEHADRPAVDSRLDFHDLTIAVTGIFGADNRSGPRCGNLTVEWSGDIDTVVRSVRTGCTEVSVTVAVATDNAGGEQFGTNLGNRSLDHIINFLGFILSAGSHCACTRAGSRHAAVSRLIIGSGATDQ